MPVTKTAKRALRVSKRKALNNKISTTKLEIAIRLAKKDKTKKAVEAAMSLVDKNKKQKQIHANKAARIKSQLSKLLPKVKPAPKVKKTSKK